MTAKKLAVCYYFATQNIHDKPLPWQRQVEHAPSPSGFHTRCANIAQIILLPCCINIAIIVLFNLHADPDLTNFLAVIA